MDIASAQMSSIPKPIDLAKQLIMNCLSKGDSAIDATLGNGHDALFLAELVGEEGKVYGFDVQELAVKNSKERLIEAGYFHFSFYLKGHEHMRSEITEPVAAVMFNLGYLPSSDKSIVSQKETTIEALVAAQSLLKVGGIITIMCYPGHDGGADEADGVLRFVSQLSRSDWKAFRYGMLNAPKRPAFLIVLEKV